MKDDVLHCSCSLCHGYAVLPHDIHLLQVVEGGLPENGTYQDYTCGLKSEGYVVCMRIVIL